jgi:flagellar hook-basal body complex protein FliE
MNILDATQVNSAVSSSTGSSSGTESLGKNQKPGNEFSEMLESAFDRVNQEISTSGEMIKNMASGEDVDIADTMIAINKADISFRMMLQVRNKALSAYEEIMRMQV